MNERIKQLIKEAGFSDDFIDDCELGYTQQKFAELIIQECIAQAELEEDRFTGLDVMDLAHAMQNFQNLLKQHFGIEE
jgi:hypothetical protein